MEPGGWGREPTLWCFVKVSIQIYPNSWLVISEVSYTESHFAQGSDVSWYSWWPELGTDQAWVPLYPPLKVGEYSEYSEYSEYWHDPVPWGECWNGGTHTWRGIALPIEIKVRRNPPFSHSDRHIPCYSLFSHCFKSLRSFFMSCLSLWFPHVSHIFSYFLMI